jgi:hypothetical protein
MELKSQTDIQSVGHEVILLLSKKSVPGKEKLDNKLPLNQEMIFSRTGRLLFSFLFLPFHFFPVVSISFYP